ncbi:MAG: hypothetical protein Q9160_001708 [Pyrenula sp. 1 TL-2023]
MKPQRNTPRPQASRNSSSWIWRKSGSGSDPVGESSPSNDIRQRQQKNARTIFHSAEEDRIARSATDSQVSEQEPPQDKEALADNEQVRIQNEPLPPPKTSRHAPAPPAPSIRLRYGGVMSKNENTPPGHFARLPSTDSLPQETLRTTQADKSTEQDSASSEKANPTLNDQTTEPPAPDYSQPESVHSHSEQQTQPSNLESTHNVPTVFSEDSQTHTNFRPHSARPKADPKQRLLPSTSGVAQPQHSEIFAAGELAKDHKGEHTEHTEEPEPNIPEDSVKETPASSKQSPLIEAVLDSESDIPGSFPETPKRSKPQSESSHYLEPLQDCESSHGRASPGTETERTPVSPEAVPTLEFSGSDQTMFPWSKKSAAVATPGDESTPLAASRENPVVKARAADSSDPDAEPHAPDNTPEFNSLSPRSDNARGSIAPRVQDLPSRFGSLAESKGTPEAPLSSYNTGGHGTPGNAIASSSREGSRRPSAQSAMQAGTISRKSSNYPIAEASSSYSASSSKASASKTPTISGDQNEHFVVPKKSMNAGKSRKPSTVPNEGTTGGTHHKGKDDVAQTGRSRAASRPVEEDVEPRHSRRVSAQPSRSRFSTIPQSLASGLKERAQSLPSSERFKAKDQAKDQTPEGPETTTTTTTAGAELSVNAATTDAEQDTSAAPPATSDDNENDAGTPHPPPPASDPPSDPSLRPKPSIYRLTIAKTRYTVMRRPVLNFTIGHDLAQTVKTKLRERARPGFEIERDAMPLFKGEGGRDGRRSPGGWRERRARKKADKEEREGEGEVETDDGEGGNGGGMGGEGGAGGN